MNVITFGSTYRKLSRIKNHSQRIFFGDSATDVTAMGYNLCPEGYSGGKAYTASYCHSGMVNILFVDGHVESRGSLPTQDESSTDEYKSMWGSKTN